MYLKELSDLRSRAMYAIESNAIGGTCLFKKCVTMNYCGDTVCITSALLRGNGLLDCVNFIIGDEDMFNDFNHDEHEESGWINVSEVSTELLCELADSI
jgi:hypothetical protein